MFQKLTWFLTIALGLPGFYAVQSSPSQYSPPSVSVYRSQVPIYAAPYERTFLSNVRLVWGLNGSMAVMAGQVDQESHFDPKAQSLYATGIAQFTPATAAWIAKAYPDLVAATPLEPAWSFRALARYDKFLYDRRIEVRDDCNRWAFTLSAYNGGEGWVLRDQSLAKSRGLDPTKWFGSVETASPRSPQAFNENRHYPKIILGSKQANYKSWGLGVTCLPSYFQ